MDMMRVYLEPGLWYWAAIASYEKVGCVRGGKEDMVSWSTSQTK
jgi:hypothetical protein